MNSELNYRDFLEVFAAWDAAYRTERATVERLYRAKIRDPADARQVARILAELGASRSTSDELLALLAAQFDELGFSSNRVH